MPDCNGPIVFTLYHIYIACEGFEGITTLLPKQVAGLVNTAAFDDRLQTAQVL